MLLRYEDLVRDPEASVRSVCTFCGLPYDASYLDVPHVNKSETPYNWSSEDRGISASRVFYYRDTLSPVEEEAVRLVISRPTLKRLYPELVEGADARHVKERLQAVSLLASSATALLTEEGRRLIAGTVPKPHAVGSQVRETVGARDRRRE